MNVTVSCEFRFFRTPDQKIWTTSSFKYEFWLRYLASFDQVTVVARIQDVDKQQAAWQRADGKAVCFFALPYYIGLASMCYQLPRLIKRLREAVKLDGAFILRVPSQTAMLMTRLMPSKTPYALEVIGDPYDVFSAGVGNKITAPILRTISTWTLKKQCQNAAAVSYVTKHYLQQRYPAASESVSAHYSSIVLEDRHFSTEPKQFNSPARKLLFVGSVEQLYKAPEVLVAAFAKLATQDPSYQLTMLGGGKHLGLLKAQATKLNVINNIHFVGEVSSQAVAGYLDNADIFVLPSRTEGLPRAMIEAMAKGLPCVGSDAGGIPELIEKPFCAPAGEINELFDVLMNLSNNVDLLNQQAMRNFVKADEYRLDKLTQRRNAYYQLVLQQTNSKALARKASEVAP